MARKLEREKTVHIHSPAYRDRRRRRGRDAAPVGRPRQDVELLQKGEEWRAICCGEGRAFMLCSELHESRRNDVGTERAIAGYPEGGRVRDSE